jgi:small subunit ribosomal protein S21
MLKVEIKPGESLDKALKILKSKVIKTKQNQILFERKQFTKKSVLERDKKLKAKFVQKRKDKLN